MADIASCNTTPDPVRVKLLIEQARAKFPEAGDSGVRLESWCGLRPATLRGTPIIGDSTVANLFLNTGHGARGRSPVAAPKLSATWFRVARPRLRRTD
jgi:D-amino-acid dehydrogenase